MYTFHAAAFEAPILAHHNPPAPLAEACIRSSSPETPRRTPALASRRQFTSSFSSDLGRNEVTAAARTTGPCLCEERAVPPLAEHHVDVRNPRHRGDRHSQRVFRRPTRRGTRRLPSARSCTADPRHLIYPRSPVRTKTTRAHDAIPDAARRMCATVLRIATATRRSAPAPPLASTATPRTSTRPATGPCSRRCLVCVTTGTSRGTSRTTPTSATSCPRCVTASRGCGRSCGRPRRSTAPRVRRRRVLNVVVRAGAAEAGGGRLRDAALVWAVRCSIACFGAPSCSGRLVLWKDGIRVSLPQAMDVEKVVVKSPRG